MRMDVKKLGGILGLMTGATAVTPDEAEAARPWNGKGVADIVEQIRTGNIRGGLLGRFSEDDLGELQKRNPEYTKPEHVMTAEDVAHVKNSRIDKPKQKHKKTPDEVGDMLNSITTSTRRRFVTTKEGHPTGIVVPHGNTTYLGILEPEDGGRAGIWTVYDPKTEKLPNKLGSSDSGRRNVPSNYAAEDGSFTQRQLSAVESDKKINFQDPLVNGAALLTGTGAALLYPGEAQAAQKNAGGASSWQDEITRGLGLGTRNVLEGLGDVSDTFLNQPVNAVGRLFGYDIGLGNPGKELADAMGLPVPETDLEKRMAFLEGGAAEAVPMILGGGAMAKMAASPVTRGVGRELFATPGRDMALGGLLGSFFGGD
ncbi:hypothetical protein [Mailhella massiliensis]|uniref:hypothetical protein n=1 Tax=Mailhella massiliensis TaxID=1903261 RepID=UPI00097CF40D|nr:hypothetical protein [Mailhella massiliensis]